MDNLMNFRHISNRVKKSGITMIEILIVIIIVGILASISVPMLTRQIEHTRGDRAISNIELIVDAIKMYYIKYEDLSVFGAGGFGGLTSLHDINTTLHLELTDSDFNYSAIRPGTSVIQIFAIRNSGIYNNDELLYEIDPETTAVDSWGGPVSPWPWHP